MSIYTSKNYRKIYEQYHGPIPMGNDGREWLTEHTHRRSKKPARIAIKLVIQPTILSGMAISVKS